MIDASIMPVIVNANTNVPSILIGEMGAKFILAHWDEQKAVCTKDLFYLNNNVCFDVKANAIDPRSI